MTSTSPPKVELASLAIVRAVVQGITPVLALATLHACVPDVCEYLVASSFTMYVSFPLSAPFLYTLCPKNILPPEPRRFDAGD